MSHQSSIWKEDKIVYKDVCFECGSDDEIHYHHLIPYSLGGTKTIPLCYICHGKVHQRKFTEHKEMVRRALKLRKEQGVILGRPKGTNESTVDFLNKYPEVVECYKESMSIRQTSKKTGVSNNTVNKIFKVLYKHF